MSKQANPKVIGGFVMGACILSVAAVLVFGSGQFLSEKVEFVLFFEGSLAGLNVGSPVAFRARNSCCGCLRPPCGGTEAIVPSINFRSACCTPSPDTSRVMDGLSDLREILSISSI